MLRENILRHAELSCFIITAIYFRTALAGFRAPALPGFRSTAVIFQRTVSVITPADETKKK